MKIGIEAKFGCKGFVRCNTMICDLSFTGPDLCFFNLLKARKEPKTIGLSIISFSFSVLQSYFRRLQKWL